MNILLVEDDPAQAAMVEQVLRASGHEVTRAARGEQAVKLLKCTVVDLVILDWQLPTMSGFDVLHWIRSHLGDNPPVLFLTSKVLEVDIVIALDAGADEYVIKPFRTPELMARVSALLRRTKRNSPTAQCLSVGAYSLDLKQRTVSLRGKVVELTTKEFEVISYLFSNAGRVVSRDILAKLAWGRELESTSRTVDTHIYRLRQKLALRSENGARLSTVYTHGYRVDEVHQAMAKARPASLEQDDDAVKNRGHLLAFAAENLTGNVCLG